MTREVARGARSLVLQQARNGVPVRIAVLALLRGAGTTETPTETPTEQRAYAGTSA